MKQSYRTDEAAEYLNVTRRTIQRRIKRGDLHVFNVGQSRRIPTSELASMIKKSKARWQWHEFLNL
jgi:excisionase family DNA binding protein